jgi:hypothetical protein
MSSNTTILPVNATSSTVNNASTIVNNKVKDTVDNKEKKTNITTEYKKEVTNIYNDVFTKSNVVLIVYFLALYFVIYFSLGLIYKKDNLSDAKMMSSRILDILVFGFVIIFIVSRFFLLSNDEKEKQLKSYVNTYGAYLDKSISILSIILFLVVFYGVIYITGLPMEYHNKPTSISIIETFTWITFTLLLFVNFFKIIFKVSLTKLFGDFFTGLWKGFGDEKAKTNNSKKTTTGGENKTTTDKKEEVFNVGNNLYTYEDAKTLCSSYGARLATYDEMENAYNKGAEWCNYGWSEGQMAFFPTQKSTWNKLQSNKKTKNNCGRPGINGGYMANPNIRFGANCYGKRPNPTARDNSAMEVKKAGSITPKTDNDIILEKKIQYWKENKDKIVTVNAFNHEKWSAY